MSDTITLKLNKKEEERLYNAFHESKHTAPPYAKWQLRPENCVITCYEFGKTVFQGKDATVYASPFQTVQHVQSKRTSLSFPQAGSDEVGTGDYFGPVCVCACIVTQDTLPLVTKLGARDSKQLTDTDILKIAPELMKHIPYSLLILTNEKYNSVHDTNNMNMIKSKLHNQAYVNLEKKYGLPDAKIIDQFTPENLYYRYLNGVPKIIRGIHFETKAEDKYPAVGVASVIARYAFLKKIEEMGKEWNMEFQKGAGPLVDECARNFVKKHGKEQLGFVAKLHFKNTEKL